jgi:hypothetical protein
MSSPFITPPEDAFTIDYEHVSDNLSQELFRMRLDNDNLFRALRADHAEEIQKMGVQLMCEATAKIAESTAAHEAAVQKLKKFHHEKITQVLDYDRCAKLEQELLKANAKIAELTAVLKELEDGAETHTLSDSGNEMDQSDSEDNSDDSDDGDDTWNVAHVGPYVSQSTSFIPKGKKGKTFVKKY